MNPHLAVMYLIFRQTFGVSPYGAQTEFDCLKLQSCFDLEVTYMC